MSFPGQRPIPSSDGGLGAETPEGSRLASTRRAGGLPEGGRKLTSLAYCKSAGGDLRDDAGERCSATALRCWLHSED
jgi:hypothetical protein